MQARNSITRRQFLGVGGLSLGTIAFTQASSGVAAQSLPRAKACILLYMDGGPSHIDLWDLKPEAPAEIRGEFRPIATSIPGIHVCEHLPRTAKQMHHLMQIRSVRHAETIHDPAVYQMLTGHKHPIPQGNLTVQPTDFPQMGTAFGAVDKSHAVMPKVIEIPETMKMDARVLPGQNAGFLGAMRDPFRVQVTTDARVVPPDIAPDLDNTPQRLRQRASLLRDISDQHRSSSDFNVFQRQALDLLADPRMRRSFDLDLESDRVRDHYGRNRHGQSVLLARRLVEAGARFVTVYWGKELQDWAGDRGRVLANNPWDTHRNHFPLLKDELLPRADRALAALLEDLHQRGLLSETLVVWMGDFGRTPMIERKYASRDHWPHANTVLFAGAGIPGGAVHGRTDRHAAQVTEDPVTPGDLTATVYHLLGVDPKSTIRDRNGRSFPLTEGQPIRAIVA